MRRASLALFALACVGAAAAPLRGGSGAANAPAAGGAFPGWPTTFEGRPLRALPLTARELRFARDFPGRLGRFSDGQREVVLRWVESPTRQLHPAEDCFRALGYALTPGASVRAADGVAWHHFEARRERTALAVREAITDGHGGRWTDTSAWYWSALLGRSAGPWWAVTVAERADP